MGIMLHAGAEPVSLSAVQTSVCPEATATHKPLHHGLVVDTLLNELDTNGFIVNESTHGMTKNDQRYFGLFQISHDDLLNGDVSTLIGLRNSHDKSTAVSIATGSRVFVCDNMAFYGEHVLTQRHTREVDLYFRAIVKVAVENLIPLSQGYRATIDDFHAIGLTTEQADHVILKAYFNKIISSTMVPTVASEFRQPSFDYGELNTYWSLYNAFTHAMKPKSQSAAEALPRRSIKLLDFLTADMTR